MERYGRLFTMRSSSRSRVVSNWRRYPLSGNTWPAVKQGAHTCLSQHKERGAQHSGLLRQERSCCAPPKIRRPWPTEPE